MSQIYDESGTVFQMGDELARGGQGVVRKLRSVNSHLVKIWHSPPSQADRRRSEALRQLAGSLSDVAALPVSLAFSDAAKTRHCGVFIPLAEGWDIFEIYNTGSRRGLLPGATFELLVKTARQTAQTFAKVHAHGLVIGDVNEKNLKVMPGHGVRLIDTDSFQVYDGERLHTSDVGTLLWTPPELQGMNLTGVERTANHDLFGLAQLIFLLLFSGRHPFAGVPVGDIDLQPHDAIRLHAFAYAPAKLGLPLSPPKAAPSFAMLSPAIQQAFLDAFMPSSRQEGKRPSAQIWADLLIVLEHNLIGCSASPAHMHWKGAMECPWCAIFKQTGADLFPRASHDLLSGVKDPAAEVLKSLQPFAFEVTTETAAVMPVQIPIQPGPQGLMSWCSRLLFRQHWQKEQMRKQKALVKQIGDKIKSRQQVQRQVIDNYQKEFQRHKKSLQAWLKSQPSMADRRSQCLEGVLKSNNQESLNKHLERVMLKDYKIPLVGDARMAKLKRAKILTAADLQPQQLQAAGMPSNVTLSLLKWRKQRERGINPTLSAVPSFQDQARVKQTLQQAEQDHQRKLAQMQQELTACTESAQQTMLATEASIRSLCQQKAQAEAVLASFQSTFSP